MDRTPLGLFRLVLLREEFFLHLYAERDQWHVTRYLWFDCSKKEREPYRLLAKRIETRGWTLPYHLALPRVLRVRVPPPVCAPQYLHCLWVSSNRRTLSLLPGTGWQIELTLLIGLPELEANNEERLRRLRVGLVNPAVLMPWDHLPHERDVYGRPVAYGADLDAYERQQCRL